MYSRLFKLAIFFIFFSTATLVFAESAPVYDADALQQQFENGGKEGQNLPPPPSPSSPAPSDQGKERLFAPSQNEAPPTDTALEEAPPINAVPENIKPSNTQQAILPNTTPSSTASLSLQDRVNRLEQQVANVQNSNAATRMEALQNEVQSLRGQVEQLTQQMQTLQSEQKNISSDLDKKLSQQNAKQKMRPAESSNLAATTTKSNNRKIEAVKQSEEIEENTETVNEATTKSPSDPNVLEEQQIYQTAYNFIKVKKYNDAVSTLQSMLSKYPSGQFASNAHYWLGELYGLMNKYDQSLTEFSAVVKNYPESPRVSDAQLKVGLIYASQFKWGDAKTAFKNVINHYPGTASAKLAREQLKQIKQAGH